MYETAAICSSLELKLAFETNWKMQVKLWESYHQDFYCSNFKTLRH